MTPQGESIEVDRYEYDTGDYTVVASAAGTGLSLQRIRPWDFGNEPGNWRANIPSAGRANRPDSGYIDNDGDGIDSVWEANNGLSDSNLLDTFNDNDNDGLSNIKEYWLGTNPNDPNSKYAPPQLVSGVGDKSGILGQSVIWEIVAQAEGGLIYHWLKDGQLIVGATLSTLNIPCLSENDIGIYQVAAISPGGVTISPPMKLTGLIPPKILTHPISQTVTNGTNAIFTVVAQGTGTINYQWLKDGSIIPGATNQTLHLKNVTIQDIGNYNVVVQDEISTVESLPAQLVVLLVPIILQDPQNQIALAGSTVEFDVQATGTPPLWYRWRRGSTGILTNFGISKLVLTNVQTVDAQYYQVIITNIARPGGIISSKAYLVVVTNWHQQDQIVDLGSSCIYTVGVAKYSSFSVSYQWLKDNIPIAGETNATLTITNASAINVGAYSVQISAEGVTFTTPEARLIINGPQISQPAIINNIIQFSITGPTNMNYWIQTSSNLIHWQDIIPLSLTNQHINFSLPLTNNTPKQFFRVKGENN